MVTKLLFHLPMFSCIADIFFILKFFFGLDVAGICPKQDSSPGVLCVTEQSEKVFDLNSLV